RSRTRSERAHSRSDQNLGRRIYASIATTEVSYASYHWNEGSRLQDPGSRRIFRKKHRGRRAERHHPRIKNHSGNEVVRSRANQRPYRKWLGSPLPGHLAGWIYTGGVVSGTMGSVEFKRRGPWRVQATDRAKITKGQRSTLA